MSTYDVVVVSAGSGGRMAARAAAAAGRTVLHVRTSPLGPEPDGVPVDTGLLTDPGPLGAAVFGPLLAWTGGQAILAKGRVLRLPVERWQLAQLLPGKVHPTAIAAWARARGKRELAQLIGGGSEQRTYHDWVVQRFGEPVYEHLHGPYAEKRFGPAATVLCGVARLHHGEPVARYAPARGWAALPDVAWEETVADVLRLGDGLVETSAGTFAGQVWVDAPPERVAGWLPGLPDELRTEAERLHARPGAEVMLRGGAALPFETHVIPADIPAFRLVRPGLLPNGRGSDLLVAHVAGAANAELPGRIAGALREAGVPDVDATGATMRELPWFHPVWGEAHLTRLRIWALELAERGVTPVGRLGLVSPLDPGQEVAIAAGLLDGEPIRELLRAHVEPPVVDPPARARLTSFVHR